VHLTVDVGALAPEVALTEPEDCKHFDVIVRGTTDGAELDRVLIATSVGRIEGSDALIGVDAVRRLASGSVGPDWEANFVAMLDFAGRRGWMTEDTEFIRAHVEWH
jgi:hypothetical protein